MSRARVTWGIALALGLFACRESKTTSQATAETARADGIEQQEADSTAGVPAPPRQKPKQTPASAQPQVPPIASAPTTQAKPDYNNYVLPLKVRDPQHVDVDEILPQMMAMARTIDEQATLSLINVLTPLDREGFVDLTTADASVGVILSFEVHYYDKTKPPGADLVQGMGSISTQNQYCGNASSPCLRAMYIQGTSIGRAERPMPKCTLRQAWAAALASGVPANAVAKANYGFWGPPTFWSFSVEGHKELARDINAVSCDVASKDDVFKAMSATRPVGGTHKN